MFSLQQNVNLGLKNLILQTVYRPKLLKNQQQLEAHFKDTDQVIHHCIWQRLRTQSLCQHDTAPVKPSLLSGSNLSLQH